MGIKKKKEEQRLGFRLKRQQSREARKKNAVTGEVKGANVDGKYPSGGMDGGSPAGTAGLSVDELTVLMKNAEEQRYRCLVDTIESVLGIEPGCESADTCSAAQQQDQASTPGGLSSGAATPRSNRGDCQSPKEAANESTKKAGAAADVSPGGPGSSCPSTPGTQGAHKVSFFPKRSKINECDQSLPLVPRYGPQIRCRFVYLLEEFDAQNYPPLVGQFLETIQLLVIWGPFSMEDYTIATGVAAMDPHQTVYGSGVAANVTAFQTQRSSESRKQEGVSQANEDIAVHGPDSPPNFGRPAPDFGVPSIVEPVETKTVAYDACLSHSGSNAK